MVRFAYLPLAFALGAAAQSVAYTDPNTGIDFMSYYDEPSGCRFGIATPETLNTDLIMQMVAPTTTGWAGLDLGATMVGKLLVVAWPQGDQIVSSFRQASGYASPPLYSGGNVSTIPIQNGTFVNSTHFSFTFVCSGCITGESNSFDKTVGGTGFGWAYSSEPVNDPSSADSALSFHSAGFGAFTIIFKNSASSKYEEWASWAKPITTPTPGNGSEPAPGNNGTTPVPIPVPTVSETTYDYIIAGAGPAGIIVAERLAESGAEVLLIERGNVSTYASGGRSVVAWNDTTTQYDVPAMSYYLSTAADTSEYCTDTADQAGCILGGGTMVNALMFVRPQEKDFNDNWPSGWKWSDVVDASNYLYQRNPGTLSPSKDGRRYDQGAYDVLSNFFSTNGWSSVNAIDEPNRKHDVFSHPAWNIEDGLRAGPVMTYLPLAQAKKNFHLQVKTSVVRAVRDGSYVTGVETQDASGARVIINVKNGGKVILAGGALSTPRILINSGIGPADQIKIVQNGNVGITLPAQSDWINLPVGKGLKDHPIVTLNFKTSTNLPALNSTAFTDPSQEDVDLFAKGSGLLVQGGQRLNFWSSVKGTDGITRFVQGTCNSPAENKIRMKVYLTHGLTSTGEIGVTAAGATKYITQPWFNTQEDKDALASFIDRLVGFTESKNSPITPASPIVGSEAIKTFVTGSHFVGTAKMGTDDGREDGGSAVVDLDTKVYGTDNLFVVDASFHPDLPTGNTQAMVMLAAEVAARKIRAFKVDQEQVMTSPLSLNLDIDVGVGFD